MKTKLLKATIGLMAFCFSSATFSISASCQETKIHKPIIKHKEPTPNPVPKTPEPKVYEHKWEFGINPIKVQQNFPEEVQNELIKINNEINEILQVPNLENDITSWIYNKEESIKSWSQSKLSTISEYYRKSENLELYAKYLNEWIHYFNFVQSNNFVSIFQQTAADNEIKISTASESELESVSKDVISDDIPTRSNYFKDPAKYVNFSNLAYSYYKLEEPKYFDHDWNKLVNYNSNRFLAILPEFKGYKKTDSNIEYYFYVNIPENQLNNVKNYLISTSVASNGFSQMLDLTFGFLNFYTFDEFMKYTSLTNHIIKNWNETSWEPGSPSPTDAQDENKIVLSNEDLLVNDLQKPPKKGLIIKISLPHNNKIQLLNIFTTCLENISKFEKYIYKSTINNLFFADAKYEYDNEIDTAKPRIVFDYFKYLEEFGWMLKK
ncbi:hypothetical protein [Mycoplasma nasistruthionis]|uniref:Lipoprotein n=1 Tax=Mycoplasma nasistruthionis TaxID=353852 RepID=A0A4Y6I6I2_9MOLU|nr:hypothetical protein [Mycoplasma nasistruthionis]QDF65133.1 hypothetical protein FIV53_02440 [Mycoplasma nasistruthionis]